METGTDSRQSRGLILILGIVLLLRLPFWNQAIQGDDPYYIFGAQHALIDPAHPSHARYIFQGEEVDMRGHPHPPLNSWMLALLIAAFGDVYEVPFHAVYTLFSLISAAAMWSLARRSSPHPLAATLLFVAVPAFVVNGNSLESDLPFLAFWMAGIALFTAGRLSLATVALALAAMTAYQAIVATPVLWAYCWFHARRSKAAWAVALTPVLVVGLYQVYERVTSGALPATVLAGYFSAYGLQQLANKLKNAAALTAHTGWLVFPLVSAIAFRGLWPWLAGVAAASAGVFIDPHPLFWLSFGVGAVVISWCVARKPDFLTAWVVLFFGSALVLFFAGSARYLLPMSAPVCLLVSRLAPLRWVRSAIFVNAGLGLLLAVVNYQHWGGYREFAREIERELREQRVWVSGEWGLRFYLESEGALPLARTQIVQAGDWIVSSELGLSIPVTAPVAPVLEREITTAVPLRLIGLGAKSGYSTAAFGFRPFDFGTNPIDRVRVNAVLERKPTLSFLPMNAPEANSQIVSGVYQLEDAARWMSGRAVLLLKKPNEPSALEVQLYVPDMALARSVTVLVEGSEVYSQVLAGPGLHTITTPPVDGSTVTIVLDKTFSVPGDFRQLGAVLIAAGFR